MADRRSPDPELENALRKLGERLQDAPTPDVSDEIVRRLQQRKVETDERRRTSALRWLRVAATVLTLTLFATLLLSVSPSARTAVADWLGVAGIKIEFLPWTPAPEISSVGDGLDLGKQLTLEEARRRADFEVLVPNTAELKIPDSVYLKERSVGSQVYLVYGPHPNVPRAAETGVGLLISEFRGSARVGQYMKSVGPDTTIEQLEVNGERGFWLEGSPRLFAYQEPDGRFVEEKARLAANTLIWDRGDITLRLEGNVSKEEALRIADSMR
ncbi:MAG: hypothetical protein ACRDSJ_20865 [Rubrobacteraceae bacterium]